MFRDRLARHAELCRKNLENPKVVRCGRCPWEDDLIREFPEFATLFEIKKVHVVSHGARRTRRQHPIF